MMFWRVSQFFIVVTLALPELAMAANLSIPWQGTWHWGNDRTRSGTVSIHYCHDAPCRFSVDTGDADSVCSAVGLLVIRSASQAEVNAVFLDEKDPVPAVESPSGCKLLLSRRDDALEIAPQGEGCSNFCGHRGTDFGAGYRHISTEKSRGALN